MNMNEISKYMSMLLRHKPEKGNIKLDKEGYTDVESSEGAALTYVLNYSIIHIVN